MFKRTSTLLTSLKLILSLLLGVLTLLAFTVGGESSRSFQYSYTPLSPEHINRAEALNAVSEELVSTEELSSEMTSLLPLITGRDAFTVVENQQAYLCLFEPGIVRKIHIGDGVFQFFGYSPDGRWLLYLKSEDGFPSNKLVMRAVNNSREHKLLSEKSVIKAAWSPTGNQIVAITREENSSFSLFAYDTASGAVSVVREHSIHPSLLK